MKAHKYWSIGALITMIGTFYTGYKGSKSGHRYFACSTLICMIMSMYTGHKMISGNKRTRKQVENTKAEENMLEVGKKAPDFELPDQNGEMHKLSDYAGKKVILYFYPKDNTPGCTKQACGFSERYPQFNEKGAVILGVSKDSVASHKRFEEKYGLAFTLLADPERKVIEAYDVWKEKKNYGKVSIGVVRTTYLIDEQGIIIKANDKVKAADDPENMLKELA